jgi:hypothetical protein
MRTRLTSLLIVAGLATPAATALAAEPPATAATGATAGAGAGRSADPNIDRGFLMPTAMTQPAGSLTYNNYELLLHGLTYGITDRVQLSVTALSPITRDMPFFATAAVKLRAPIGERLHLAFQGTGSYGHIFDDGDGGDLVMLGAGALGSFCLRADCSSLLSAGATYQLATASGTADEGHLIIYGASLVHRVGAHVKLLGEVASAAIYSSGDDLDNAPGLMASYGVRFHGDSLAADVGFMKPLSTDGDLNDELLLGLPFVNLSYRW